jgi:hypothetical protein
VASQPAASGGDNEYCFYLKITSTTVSGLTVGQQVWSAATVADFPNLLTVGTVLTGKLDNSSGWWSFKTAGNAVSMVIAPSITTGSPSSISTTGATLNGSLMSTGTTASVTVSFDWGTTTS